MPRFTETLVDFIDGHIQDQFLGAIMGGKLVLGGGSGPTGGSGIPWRGVIGQLVQTKVAYDTTEAATISTSGNTSLLDNLNHIRYWINNIDASRVVTTLDDAVTPAVTLTFPISIAGGAAADKDIVVAQKVKVIDAWGVMDANGEAGDTIQVKNSANAITNAMPWSGVTDDIVRASGIDNTYATIAQGGTLRVTTVDNDSGNDVASGKFYVLAIRVS